MEQFKGNELPKFGGLTIVMRYRFCWFLCFLILPLLQVSAQRDESLLSGQKPRLADTVKVVKVIYQTNSLIETNPARALQLLQEARVLSQKIGYQKGIGRATGNMARIYYRNGDLVKALENASEAVKISEKIGDKLQLAQSLNSLAAIYYQERDFTQGMLYLQRALSISRQIDDQKTVARSLNNIAHTFQTALNNSDSARFYAQQSLAVVEKTGDTYNGAYANRTLGEIEAKVGNYNLALKHFYRSLDLSTQVSKSLKVSTWLQIADVYIQINKLDKALPILVEATHTAELGHFHDELEEGYRLMSDLYQKKGDLAASLDYLRKYTVLKDSTYNEQNQMRMATLKNQLELDLKQVQIELLTKDTELSKKEISRQKIQLYATIGGFAAILAIAALLFYGNRKMKQTNVILALQKEELAAKNREVESKSKELELQANQLAHLNATKDKLFSIISHDFRSPINSLKSLMTLAENKNLSQDEFAGIAGVLRANLDTVSTNLDNLLHWSLAQLQGIQTHPVKINLPTLVEEHVSLFSELAKAKSIRLESDLRGSLFALADEDHTRLVLRNLINNAIKFTRPGGVVRISSQEEKKFVKIMVSDTGVGIEAEQLHSLFLRDKNQSTEGTNREKGVGLGLILCQEFVETNGGHMAVASEPGKGSVFSFTLKAA
jgi:two-component system, sensor histidine kinase and response regulator